MKVLGLFLVAIAGCYAATTVELLAANPNESQLVALVQAAGLVDTLNRGRNLSNYLFIYLFFIHSLNNIQKQRSLLEKSHFHFPDVSMHMYLFIYQDN